MSGRQINSGFAFWNPKYLTQTCYLVQGAWVLQHIILFTYKDRRNFEITTTETLTYLYDLKTIELYRSDLIF